MLQVTFEELYKESRKITLDKDNISQTIVAHLCGNFYEEAEIGPGGLYSDDILVIQSAYNYFPVFYSIPVPSGDVVIITITSLELEQVNNTTWKVTAKYDVPNDGGKSGGGQGTTNIGDVGPGAGENNGQGWSQNFTQLSANGSVTTRKRSYSLATLDCQRNINLAAGVPPYTVGDPAPIGHTDEGIEGTDVYEREFSFNITTYMPPERLKYAFVRKLSRMQTTLNKEIFFGFSAREVMFLEYDFSGDLYQVVPVTLSFKQRNNFKFLSNGVVELANPNVEGSFDTFIDGEFFPTNVFSGWDVVDYRYFPVPDVGAKMVVQRPILRTIHQLYELSDFGAFEL